MAFPLGVQAQAPITEATVAERVRARALPALRAEIRAARARAAADEAAPHPNPSIEYERQEAFEPNPQSQDLIWARVPIDLSGRRAAERELRQLDAAEAEAEAELARVVAVAEALRLFYRALSAERRAEVLADHQRALDEAARVAASQEEAGHGSGYRSTRLAIEASLGRSHAVEAQLEREALRVRLLRWLGLGEDARLQGSFAVDGPPNGDGTARPEVRAAEAMGERADDARAAARRSAVPRVTVSGAYNRQAEIQAASGYGLSVEVEVPLFDRGQAERAEAEAAQDAIARYRDALDSAVGSEVAAARARLAGLVAERERLAGTVDDLDALVRAAEVGYREGERSLVEVLDAQRTVLAARERLVALDLAVRLADVELRRALGRLP